MLNITTFLDANACRLDKTVFMCPDRGTVYNSRDILSIASSIARDLLSLGVKKGDRVMLYMDNSPEYLFSYFAVWRIGAVAVPTNRVYTRPELEYMIKNSEARVMVTDSDGAKLSLEGVSAYVPGDIEALRNAEILPPSCTSYDDLCQLQYTSGTTGRPKGAMLTHGGYLAAIHNECDVLAFRQDDVYLGIYPMGHVGLSWGIAALRAGALYIMMERYSPGPYLALCKKYNVTVLSGMPPVIHSLATADDAAPDTALASVREIISGGGPLHNEIWKKFHYRYHIPVINAYGLSETIVIGTGTVIRPEDYATADRFESVGHPVCFSEVKIVDELDSSKEMPTGKAGEIALRGPAVALGYFNMPEETKEAFLSDGWFLTGDVGYLDTDHRLFITDRKKDMIVMSGWKVYPTEVEDALLKYEGIKEIAVFGIPDSHRGELPCAAVIWKEGFGAADGAELIEFARKNLAGYKVPRKIITTEELPRVNGWKLLRRELREKYS
ncbi:MAG TPA: AMP-binding protein [Methanocorpusculum sp.]|nr:AMP-binding protein [Methanocorpusculum sp.]